MMNHCEGGLYADDVSDDEEYHVYQTLSKSLASILGMHCCDLSHYFATCYLSLISIFIFTRTRV